MYRYHASLIAGTIFHKTKTTLIKWFWLIQRMETSMTGVSIAKIQRELEIKDYKTAWMIEHKIRISMLDRVFHYKLAGLVEIDESFFEPSKSGKRGRGSMGKSLVIVAVSTWKDETGEEKHIFAHAIVAQDASAHTIKNILTRLSIPDGEIEPLINKIRTDGWRSYQTVAKDLDIAHHRALLADPKDSLKLLPMESSFDR